MYVFVDTFVDPLVDTFVDIFMFFLETYVDTVVDTFVDTFVDILVAICVECWWTDVCRISVDCFMWALACQLQRARSRFNFMVDMLLGFQHHCV